jgi:hypothetical protein
MGANADIRFRKEKMKTCFFTIADNNNLKYANMAINSLKKFHPDIPHFLFGQEGIDKILDPHKFYRMYAQFGERLSKDYDLVCNLDADSIVTGSLDHIINDESFELGGVLNNNKIDPPISLFDIPSPLYINAGFVAVRSPRVWNWWNKLNFSSNFDKHQYREQDMLNIIFHYGDFRTKIFDFSEKWHGLIHKGQWNKFVLKDGQLILPKTEGICDEDKEIKIIHWAGGNVPKMNYHVYFTPEVVSYLDSLVKGDKNG